MADRQTGSVWTHYDGTVLTGPLADSDIRLEIQPLIHTTWAEWKALHPDTVTLPWLDEFSGRYRSRTPGGDAFGASFEDSLLLRDDRLPDTTLVVGASLGEEFKAYPLADFGSGLAVINDTLSDIPVVIFINPDNTFGLGYIAVINGLPLTFSVENGEITDESGNIWKIDGTAMSGPLAGTQLDFATSFVTEWYGWVAYHPETGVYGE